jgi:predicted nuclease with TOPRIM domain
VRRARAAALVATALLAGGCATEDDVRKPLQEHLAITGRIVGFALDAQTETLEMKLALLEADPKLEARLGKPEEVRQKLERVRAEQRDLQAALKELKDRYPPSDEGK